MNTNQYDRSETDYVAPRAPIKTEDLKSLVLQQANLIKSLDARIALLERKLLRTQGDVALLESRIPRTPR